MVGAEVHVDKEQTHTRSGSIKRELGRQGKPVMVIGRIMGISRAFVFLLVFFPAVCFAEPFLVCDPMTDATETQVTLDGNQGAWVPYLEQQMEDGNTYCVLLDLAGLTNGSHTVTAKARNFWGESAPSNPFVFGKQDAPVPGGFGLKRGN